MMQLLSILPRLNPRKYEVHIESLLHYRPDFKTIKKIQQDERIENLLFSHEYEPWFQNGVFGREQVEKILKDCITHAK